MPQMKAAEKALRQTKKRTVKNDQIRKNLDYLLRSFKKAINIKDGQKSQEIAKQLAKALDKAAQKRVIKKNNAARKKSRLMKKVKVIK
ncbi:MAG TPA: 30S ribosomal protein S20 [bacterium]|nr:30S ribosomal protein S20 [bacterium]HPL95522.1 30S ribosomal protein S20 [bacterium]